MTTALYAGSFDPVTNGHIDIIKRASTLFEKVYVGVATNLNKRPLFSVDERQHLLEQVVSAEKLTNITVDSFGCLTVEYARREGIQTIIRGLRAISDFEAEFQMAIMNRQLDSSIETVFLMPSQDYFYVSSNLIKEIIRLNGPVNKFVPVFVEEALRRKLKNNENKH